MSNLPVVSSGGLSGPLSRRGSRALAALDDQTTFALARIEHAADLQVARVDAVGFVGERAMQRVAMVSQMEQQLVSMVPLAASRIQAIGDMVALAAVDIVADTRRQVGR